MISRFTLRLILVALLIPSGLAVWQTGHRDNCSRFLAGDASRPATTMVEAGGHMVEVPCSQWLPRQPLGVQLLCLAEGVLLLIVLINVFGDVIEAKKVRGGAR